MRYHQFKINEYTDLETEKQTIIKTISGLDASNEEEAAILDRIYKILNSDRISSTIDNAFSKPIADESLSDNAKKQIIRDVTEILGTLSVDYKRMNQFLDKMEQGGVINTTALGKSVSSFESVFDNDVVAQMAFLKLANYGSGKNQKGPGEYALAMLSDKISLRPGGGDLDIEGLGQVELKAAVGVSGGRLGHGGLAQKDAKAALEKYHDNVPALKQHFEQGAKGMSLKNFQVYLASGLPPRDEANKKLRYEIGMDLYGPVFGEFAKAMATALTQDDYNVLEAEFLKANYAYYLDKDYFDVLLLCSFSAGKFAAVRNADELIALKQAGHLSAPAPSAVPTNAGMREVFSKVSLSKAKI